ncbi:MULTISPECIES: TerB family tellurite resistance protein [Rhizobiaceae]|uniref:TerB family tellurite resistance protein n=1 Tax=Peteryoungia algae TaxID=2919917 RepID=A0ABT0D3H0_9HYPH|nr:MULTISPECIES: TerB family tellurite resistance protein [unclassified Rhizobium]MCC8933001.1 TerB family tellurite resistance protein [Rhizobium sp. 'Codium 1']MCJ8239955.1 TerB family tellurite resistance protein [Rhizobium sp. SSM4.3]
MLDRLQAFFQSVMQDRPKAIFAPDDPRIAVAALCLQVMEADGIVRDSERAKLREILKDQYELDGEALDALIAAGQDAENQAVDYYRFTTELKRQLDEEQRHQLVGLLWDIVYADGTRSEMEDHAIWRVADLLGVSGRERIVQRQEAADRAGIGAIDDAS